MRLVHCGAGMHYEYLHLKMGTAELVHATVFEHVPGT